MISRVGFWVFGFSALLVMLYAAGRGVNDPAWGLFGVLFGAPTTVALCKWNNQIKRSERR